MKTIATKRHKRLIELLIAERKARGLSQEEVAHALRRKQAWMARIEGGDRRIDVVEFLDLADAIGFDPFEALATIQKVGPDRPPRAAKPRRSRPTS